LPLRSHTPRLDYPSVRVVRMSGAALTSGIQTAQIGQGNARVYSPAKTVADCFKFRNTVGIDVAIEALRDCWRKKSAPMNELWHYAAICRVVKVMRPYLESIIA